MKHSTSKTRFSFLQEATAAVALLTLSAAASALPSFTLNPGAAGLNGANITADNILISDYSTITSGAGGTFTETGYLAVTGFQLGGATIVPAGLNTDYGMYIAFTGTGTTTTNDPTTSVNFGSFTTLTYTLYGYNGSATFGFTGNTPTETASGEVALATGTLLSGTVLTVPTGNGAFSPSANASLTLTPSSPAFFSSPTPFYSVALTAFSNTSSQVEPFAGGFMIRQGGGSLNFAPVPEPSSAAMLFGGLAAVGFLYRRRQGGAPRR